MIRQRLAAALGLSAVFLITSCTVSAEPAGPSALVDGNEFFTGAAIAESTEYFSLGHGDLWPNCWGADDNIYAAHGDGLGFGTVFGDVGVNVIEGQPGDLTGETLALGDDVGSVWTPGDFNRKPTGMACVDGNLYVAVQDLRLDFNEAPAASISQSTDGGRTWNWDTTAPMFDDHVFTTIFFLDYGRDYEHSPDDYVYAYGLDNNWRDSFDDSVPDPVELYLARVPSESVLDRSTWEFFSGTAGAETPEWSSDIDARTPVLRDDRTLYTENIPADVAQTGGANLTVLSQGSVVYNAPLERYIYTSWTELTYEFYESPTPWGPWNLFMSKDFGRYPWTDDNHGGYGTTIPSKFISEDGRSMLVQSNVCPCAPAGMSMYVFALRELTVE